MRKVFIGFSRPTTRFPIFAWIIQWVEARPYDHAYIRLQEPQDGDYLIFQASKEMVNLYNKDVFLQSNQPLKEYEISCSEEEYPELWRFVKVNLGIPYSLKEDFGILLMKIFKIKQPFNDGPLKQFCSKLATMVCKLLGVSISEDAGSIDPTELDSLLESHNLPCNNDPKF